MQQVQNMLDFEIETPSDEELAKRFKESAKRFSEQQAQLEGTYQQTTPVKHKKRKSKSAKKLARANKNFKKCKYRKVAT